jgi:membrane protein YqaA with SNARE-associated domain
VKLVTFLLLAIVVHGPLSPLLPTAFETTLLYYVRFYPAWLLALVGTLGASLAEAVNYRLVHRAAEVPKLAALTTRRAVRWSVGAFLRAPFWTTVIVIFSPIPDSAVRILAPLGGYPLPRFLAAVALGRFPRLLLIAGFGVLVPIPAWLLLGAGLVLVVVGLGRRHAAAGLRWLWRRRWTLREPFLGRVSRRTE